MEKRDFLYLQSEWLGSCPYLFQMQTLRGSLQFEEDPYDQRPSLKQDTLIALMTLKFNAYNDCYDSSFSDELLTKCKKAAVNAVKKSTDDAHDD